MNRAQRKELARRVCADDPGLEVVHRNVAGIDVGIESHYVTVAPGCDPQPVREFGGWTADLKRMPACVSARPTCCGSRKRAIRGTPVLTQLAQLYDEARDEDRAMALCERVLRLDPAQVTVAINLGAAATFTGAARGKRCGCGTTHSRVILG